MMNWLPKKARTRIFVPERCPFRINPDPKRCASQLNFAVVHDELWLVDEDAASDLEELIPQPCCGDLLEGMLPDGTIFVLPLLYPMWNPGDWHISLHTLVQQADAKWLTVMADSPRACFTLASEQQQCGNPGQWPSGNFSDLVESAFAGRYIGADFIARMRSFRGQLEDACDHGSD